MNMTYMNLSYYVQNQKKLYINNFNYTKMWNASSFQTPRKKQSSILSNIHLLSQQSAQPQLKSTKILSMLYQKFSKINSTIDVDITKANFNLISYDKRDQKMKHDPQMAIAKLKQLQNRAEINRAEMQLETRRKKKKSSAFKPQQNQFQQLSYNDTYKMYKANSKLLDLPIQDSDSDIQVVDHPHNGIARFHELKKHSKILQYTLEKIKQKQDQVQKQKNLTTQRKLQVKNETIGLHQMGEQYADYLFKNKDKKQKANQQAQKNEQKTKKNIQNQNPQNIVEERYKRILTMKAKDKISQEVKKNARCNHMINKQNQIILDLQNQSKSLSKENFKKLKSRFAEIVNEIHKGDRKRKQAMLPNLTTR